MVILLYLIGVIWMIASPSSFFTVALLLIAGTVIYYINQREKTKRLSEELSKKNEERKLALKKIREKYNVPVNYRNVRYKHGHPSIQKDNFDAYIWTDNEILYIVDKTIDFNIGKIEIPLKDIEYYDVRGEVHRETKISGGETVGGGTSIGGAIAGGLIAGEAGAIIGSRKKVKSQPIVSKTITHDERETFLNFFINDKGYTIFFDSKAYNSLFDIIPNKSYTSIYNSYIVNQANKDEREKTLNQIRKIAQLRDEGILSDEEFEEKKKQLLDKI